ncbi:MAG: type II toxin-antitoxin system Phd/YefM family antitoxin [Pseudomonadota bacterium]
MRFTATRLRVELFKVLDKILKTGVPVEIERKGKILKIVPVEPEDKLKNLSPHPDFLKCDPEDIIHMDWSGDWRP